MSDFPNSAEGAGSVRYINPDSLIKNPAFTNVVVVEGNVKTVHIGGQDALNASGEIVGKGDIVAQVEQILANLRAALAAVRDPSTSSSGTSTWSRGNRCRLALVRSRTLGPRCPTRLLSRGCSSLVLPIPTSWLRWTPSLSCRSRP